MLKFKTYGEAKSIFRDNNSIEAYALITEILQNQLDADEEAKYNSAQNIDALLDALSIENLKYLKKELKYVYKPGEVSPIAYAASRAYSTEFKKFIQNYAENTKPDWFKLQTYNIREKSKYPAILSWFYSFHCSDIEKFINPKIRDILSRKQHINFDKLEKDFDKELNYYGSEDNYIDILILKFFCPLFRGFKELKSAEEIINNQPVNNLLKPVKSSKIDSKDSEKRIPIKLSKIDFKQLIKLTKVLCLHWYYILKDPKNNNFSKYLETKFNKRIEILNELIDKASSNDSKKQVVGDLDESLAGIVSKEYYKDWAGGEIFNRFLRYGEDADKLGKDRVTMLDKFIEQNALKKSMKLYRGLGKDTRRSGLLTLSKMLQYSSPVVNIDTEIKNICDEDGEIEENLNSIIQKILKVKPVIHDKGYMSCSAVRSVSKRWGSFGATPVLLEMNITQKTPAIYVNKLPNNGVKLATYEEEILIKHGSKFKIIDGCIKYHQKEYPYLVLELDYVQ